MNYAEEATARPTLYRCLNTKKLNVRVSQRSTTSEFTAGPDELCTMQLLVRPGKMSRNGDSLNKELPSAVAASY